MCPSPPTPRDASAADEWATSGLPALSFVAPGTSVSKGRARSPDHGHQPLHPHIHTSHYSTCAVDRVLTLPVRFLFPHTYIYDVLVRASVAQSLLVTDCCASYTPLHCFISNCLFGYDHDASNHLIIVLPSCTLRIYTMHSIFLSRYSLTFSVSQQIQLSTLTPSWPSGTFTLKRG
jgi:hypothetical protein